MKSSGALPSMPFTESATLRRPSPVTALSVA
jgi:hypothetical protein